MYKNAHAHHVFLHYTKVKNLTTDVFLEYITQFYNPKSNFAIVASTSQARAFVTLLDQQVILENENTVKFWSDKPWSKIHKKKLGNSSKSLWRTPTEKQRYDLKAYFFP